MKKFVKSLVLFVVFLINLDASLLPVSYKGRFRPLHVYEQLWIQDTAKRPLPALTSESYSQELILWKLHFLNDKEFGSNPEFLVLPSRKNDGTWLSLRALNDSKGNVTLYPDPLFNEIQTTYLELQKEFDAVKLENLKTLLIKGYEPLAGKHIQGKLYYPTFFQLEAEEFYYKTPLITITLLLYALACVLLFAGAKFSTFVLLAAFAFHTFILALRCIVLGRPPVSNMFETIVYVPWVAVLLSLMLKERFALIASCLLSIVLLVLLKITDLGSSMENVQAVLDSQYWLITHVLLVVGSYGAFLLSGVLGHLYLIAQTINPQYGKSLPKNILHTLYIGTFMLISGTILGGVWAAESWGRFWDWDPKESWAFISSAMYLVCIHAYRFNHIGNFGLAIGSVIGLLAITFTWYGVNYVLGTGLHSYGFGSGGTHWYFLFIVLEALFLVVVSVLRYKNLKNGLQKNTF